jgi:hypothetical protein
MDRPRPSPPHTRLRAVALLALVVVLAACGVPERGPAPAASWIQLCRRAGQRKTADHLDRRHSHEPVGRRGAHAALWGSG